MFMDCLIQFGMMMVVLHMIVDGSVIIIKMIQREKQKILLSGVYYQ